MAPHRRLLLALALFAVACDNTPLTQPLSSVAGTTEKVVLVGFVSTPGVAGSTLIESLGGRVIHQYKYIPVLAAAIPTAQEDILEAHPTVAYVEDDLPIQPLGSKQITDYGVSLIEAPAAWASGFRGQGIKVGIFDSGIDIDHPDLTVAGGVDLVGDGNGLDDCQGHGTHVAGIVAAGTTAGTRLGWRRAPSSTRCGSPTAPGPAPRWPR